VKASEVRSQAAARPATAPEDVKKKAAFAKVLDAKSEEQPPAVFGQPVERPFPEVEAAETPAAVQMPKVVDGVANEIAVAVRGARDVEIQFDSKTLAGLHVRVTSENGRLNVTLQSESPEARRLLAQHTDGLVQRLEAKGYARPVVRVKPGAGGREQGRDRRR
jgi:type III secretion system needle length determinant